MTPKYVPARGGKAWEALSAWCARVETRAWFLLPSSSLQAGDQAPVLEGAEILCGFKELGLQVKPHCDRTGDKMGFATQVDLAHSHSELRMQAATSRVHLYRLHCHRSHLKFSCCSGPSLQLLLEYKAQHPAMQMGLNKCPGSGPNWYLPAAIPHPSTSTKEALPATALADSQGPPFSQCFTAQAPCTARPQ